MAFSFLFFFFKFADIDECALAAVTGLQACHGNAKCRNSPGSFTCSCPSGYVMALNGQSCVGEADVDNLVCMTVFEAFYLACTPGGSSEG